MELAARRRHSIPAKSHRVLSTARVGTGTRLSPLRVELVQPRQHVKTIQHHPPPEGIGSYFLARGSAGVSSVAMGSANPDYSSAIHSAEANSTGCLWLMQYGVESQNQLATVVSAVQKVGPSRWEKPPVNWRSLHAFFYCALLRDFATQLFATFSRVISVNLRIVAPT